MALSATPSNTPSGENKSRSRRNRRPDYNAIHANPLPLKLHPLPPLFPSNPLSVLYIAYVWLSQFLFPPSSHPPKLHQAYWSPETRSVHVTDVVTARVFWDNGFFGKGSLSRSEPNWVEKEKKRRGLVEGQTAEEVTRRRRAERREFKLERAKKERDIIEEKLREGREEKPDEVGNEEVKANGCGVIGNGTEILPERSNGDLKELGRNGTKRIAISAEVRATDEHVESMELPSIREGSAESTTEPHGTQRSEAPPSTQSENTVPIPFENQEHLQLTLEEAFFLAWGLGVLEIVNPETHQLLPTSSLLPLFRSYSYFPPLRSTSFTSLLPDDPFLLSYIPYHHYRSLGWVVRPGIKFGVDFLLYIRGPVFSHAEFAVKVLPSYGKEGSQKRKADGKDKETGERMELEKGDEDGRGNGEDYWYATKERAERTRKKEDKPWNWLTCAQRVQAQVMKSLVLCYVEVPPPILNEDGEEVEERDVKKLIQRYKVRDFIIKRWVPSRDLA